MPTQAGAVSEGMCSGARRLSPSASRMEGSERVEGLGQSHLDGGRGGTSGTRLAVGRGLLLRPPRHWVPRQVWSGRGRLAEPTSHPCWGADRSRHRRVSLLFLPGEEAKRCEKDRAGKRLGAGFPVLWGQGCPPARRGHGGKRTSVVCLHLSPGCRAGGLGEGLTCVH